MSANMTGGARTRWHKLLVTARKRTQTMDAVDAAHGFAAPAAVPLSQQCDITLEALEAAYTRRSFSLLAEAFVYVEAIRQEARKRGW